MTEGFVEFLEVMKKAKKAATVTAGSTGLVRNAFLIKLAKLIDLKSPEIIQANQRDMEEGQRQGVNDSVLDRLLLNDSRLKQLSEGLNECVSLSDPIGAVEDQITMNNGLTVGRRRIPLGLIGFICEARPGAVVEAAAMAVKSGNALLAKPGRDAYYTSLVFNQIIAQALTEASLPAETVIVKPALSQAELSFMVSQADILDLVIPRGGQSLIEFIDLHSRVPVLRHYKGVNHLFVERSADLAMALELTVNGKCNRPSTCNALECLLVDEKIADVFLPRAVSALTAKGVKLYGDPKAAALSSDIIPAQSDTFGQEFLDLILAVKVVEGLPEAMEHISQYGSRHTETICTDNLTSANEFLNLVDASCVMVNASTRLNDGGCLGLGAEIGISTSKIHAYGPMGLKELTTTKFVVVGNGHLRS
ncbi:MAG: glutamate-5-semialdehyde dehydrogenase [Deltaproteobacteria bacterium]|nr:glutamate-5-semialdehyde dehydrogenase [Deltaproteobacteria bacterium]